MFISLYISSYTSMEDVAQLLFLSIIYCYARMIEILPEIHLFMKKIQEDEHSVI